ncbi:MAG TPA: hypothetical protein VJ997_05145, partial [Longimicrobiales bacterium]|nr:hypothetical protein [Longimicrobiales bacterium]
MNRRRLRTLLVGALVLGIAAHPSSLAGQVREPSATISSDRPGLGDGAYVMAPREWQAEFGGTIQAATADDYLVGSSL